LQIVEAANWSLPQTRPVSGGIVPQVAHTYAYFTKVGGYASINEHQVGLAESTCNAVFFGQREKAVLNIVDLSELGLERANTSRAAVAIMGALAEAHGYYDAGESLFVVDPAEAFIFHVLPDPSGTSAVWVAQRVPDSHVGVVANAFTVRVGDLNDSHALEARSALRLHTNLLWTGAWAQVRVWSTYVGRLSRSRARSVGEPLTHIHRVRLSLALPSHAARDERERRHAARYYAELLRGDAVRHERGHGSRCGRLPDPRIASECLS
jgi:hypothetical protein